MRGEHSKELLVLEGKVTRIKVIDNELVYKIYSNKNIFKRLFMKNKVIFDIKSSDEIKTEKSGYIGYSYLVWIEDYKINAL